MLPRLTEAVELARRMARRLALRGQQEDSRLPGPTGWEDTEVLRLVRPPSETAPRASLKVSSSVNSWHCGKKGGTVTRRHIRAAAATRPLLMPCLPFRKLLPLSFPCPPFKARLYRASSRKPCVISTIRSEPPSPQGRAGSVAERPPSLCHAPSP